MLKWSRGNIIGREFFLSSFKVEEGGVSVSRGDSSITKKAICPCQDLLLCAFMCSYYNLFPI